MKAKPLPSDAEDARRIMLDMISEYMPTELPRNAPMAWHHMLRFEPTAEGFKLVGPHLTQRFNNSNERPFFRNLGELSTMGRHDAESLAAVVASDCKVTSGAVCSALNELFHLGVLDDTSQIALQTGELGAEHLRRSLVAERGL